MNDETRKMTEDTIIELSNEVLAIEREVRSDKSGNRTTIVAKILSWLNEVIKNDNH